MSFRRSKPTSPETCPGIKSLIRPTLSYTKCGSCGGDVEIWSDEDTGVCLKCGKIWPRPDSNASCLEYCDYADKCREIIKAHTTK